MTNKVFVNGREIACKAAKGKTICAFPDVCFTPPQTPATPPGVPIPYPNTGMASDTTNGSKHVKVSNKEVGLKNKSYFKQSTGDEAGSAPKKGILTSKTKGKVYFNSWSMDVRIEGQNAVRHLDMTTANHSSHPGNEGVPWPYLDTQDVAQGGACESDAQKEKDACSDYTPHGKEDLCEELINTLPYTSSSKSKKPSGSKASPQAHDLSKHHAADNCMNARRCFLMPYTPKTGVKSCCPTQTPHHLIEASSLFDQGRGGESSIPLLGVNTGQASKKGMAYTSYNEHSAPCICAEGKTQHTGTHGIMHTYQSIKAMEMPKKNIKLTGGGIKYDHSQTYKQAKKNANEARKKAFPASFCDDACIEKQLDNYHNQCGIDDDTEIKAVVEGSLSPDDVSAAKQRARELAHEAWESYMGDNFGKAMNTYLPPGLPIF